MDVHKDARAVAYVAQDYGAAVPYLGTIGPRQCDLDKPLRTMQSKAPRLTVVSAAAPGGFWLYRDLTSKGDACKVVAPSRTSKKSGDRVTTDRRDAVSLARLMRSGALTPVYVPAVADEAMRELS